MWKLIIVLILIIYLLNKVSVVLFRVMGRNQPPPRPSRRPEGCIHVDNSGQQAPRKGGNIKGGEYVDYEEVK